MLFPKLVIFGYETNRIQLNHRGRVTHIRVGMLTIIGSDKNIKRHTAHTIVSWPNPKQWIIVHTSDLMMIIRQSNIFSQPSTGNWVNCKQGSHAFRMMKFLDFSRTFPGPNLIFQGPSQTKTTINTHKYSLPSNRFSLLLHKQGKQWFNGTYQEILMNNISEICVNNIQVSH